MHGSVPVCARGYVCVPNPSKNHSDLSHFYLEYDMTRSALNSWEISIHPFASDVRVQLDL